MLRRLFIKKKAERIDHGAYRSLGDGGLDNEPDSPYSFSDDCYTPTPSPDLLISEHGYSKIRLISDNVNGQLMEAERVHIPTTNKKRCQIHDDIKHVKIKIVEKKTLLSTPTDQSILKQSLILHHLTVANRPTADYIPKFIECFQDEHYFCLVMEYCGDTTLADFSTACFHRIVEKKLSMKEYKKIVKYLIWQISALLFWLHDNMNCCHLNLKLDTIYVQNADFIFNDDGSCHINPTIKIKIGGWSFSEIFKNSNFNCSKKMHYYGNKLQYYAPAIFNENIYDARSADIWALGVISFKLLFAKYPFKNHYGSLDGAYCSIQHDRFDSFMTMNQDKFIKYGDTAMMALLCGTMKYDANKRFNAKQIIEHEWFTSYFKRYRQRIEEKTISQKERLNSNELRVKMQTFPFYTTK